jgi:hypothetical protein
VVNTPNEHIRFRYLHMRPKLLDAAGVMSGRKVSAGELLGQIGNFSQHENGTSYHVHFDIQVPTRAGWVFVSPYMTLVAAYERLIGGRGAEVTEEMIAGVPVGTADGDSMPPLTLAAIQQAIFPSAERAPAVHAAPVRAVPVIEARPPVRVAGAGCGVHVGHHRVSHGCAAPPPPTARPVHGMQVRYPVSGSSAARAAVVSHRAYRRHRT